MHAAVVEYSESFLINPESGQGRDPKVRLESVIIGTEGPRQARTEPMNDNMARKKRLPATRKYPVSKSRTPQFGDRAVVLEKEYTTPQVRSVYGDESFFIEEFACRREVNPDYLAKLEAKGLDFIDKGSTGNHGDVSELKGHPWCVGDQFRPDFMMRAPARSEWLLNFVRAVAKHHEDEIGGDSNDKYVIRTHNLKRTRHDVMARDNVHRGRPQVCCYNDGSHSGCDEVSSIRRCDGWNAACTDSTLEHASSYQRSPPSLEILIS
jgi:hypothetical protein